MGGIENLRLLRPDANQLGDVEEAPVVDLLARHPPERQLIRLFADQSVEKVEAAGIALFAVEDANVLIYKVTALLESRVEFGQPLLNARCFAAAEFEHFPFRGSSRGQALYGFEKLSEFVEQRRR